MTFNHKNAIIIIVVSMNINELPLIMLICLSSTIVIELIMSLLLGMRNKKDILNVILVNIMTNPLVVSILMYITYNRLFNTTISIIILEILVILTEGFTYKKVLTFDKINPYVLSLILNISSYFIGLLYNSNHSSAITRYHAKVTQRKERFMKKKLLVTTGLLLTLVPSLIRADNVFPSTLSYKAVITNKNGFKCDTYDNKNITIPFGSIAILL